MTIHDSYVKAAAVLAIAGLAMASCGKRERGSMAGPSPVTSVAVPGVTRSAAYPAVGGLGQSVINFPPRNEPNAFFQDLIDYYRDTLHREPSSTYVDPEGENVWLTEYFRFYLNGCPHQEAISRTLSEITSGASLPVCGAENPIFPPRNLPFEFQGQLETTYRDALRREQITSYVDSEGANVWLAQYLRLRVTGGCDHTSAAGKVFLEIGGSGVQPDCSGGGGNIPQAFVLSGEWERFNSSFSTLDGMIVRVSGDGSQAIITSTPPNPFQFQVGDLKWRNISRVSDTRFSFEDLVRQSGSGAMSYVSGFIDAQANGAELNLSFPTTGTFQQWRRP